MKKRIILLSDGTGNSAASIWRTNVWRIFQAIDLTEADQIASYDDGIGTSAFRPFGWFGGIFGYGLKRNVIECYKFLCRNCAGDPNSGDPPELDIFLFGFSRGAFTVRVLIELLMSEGIVPYNQSERELHRAATAAFDSFRRKRGGAPIESVVLFFKALFQRKRFESSQNLVRPEIRFVGLWDTVSAYGLPMAEMTKLFSRLVWSFDLAGTTLSTRVKRACHALSLDEERTTFRPLLWTEADETAREASLDGFRYIKDERISQVWFAGVHSNVGGGYPDDALAHITLSWMMKEAANCGLRFKTPPKSDPDAMLQLTSVADKDGRLYDSRSGLAASYRYGPRKLSELCNARSTSDYGKVDIHTPKIHHTVFERMLAGAFPYAPLGVPARYSVVNANGKILEPEHIPFEGQDHAEARAKCQELVWNRVFLRSFFYFTTLAAATALILYPFYSRAPPSAEYYSPLIWVSNLIRLAGAFVPGAFEFWINAYARSPEIFLTGAFLLLLSQYFGKRLKASISDEIRAMWRMSLAGTIDPNKSLIYRIRTNAIFLFARDALTNEIIPVVTMLVVAFFFFGFLFHTIFYITDAAGFYCRGTSVDKLTRVDPAHERSFHFMPSDICNKSGILLEENAEYEISVEPAPGGGEFDGRINTNFKSGRAENRFGDLSSLVYHIAWPIQRTITRPLFTIIGRVGRFGADEFFFDANPDDRQTRVQRYRPHRSGELFLYVNDISLPLPGLSNFFYLKNKGSADVVIKRTD